VDSVETSRDLAKKLGLTFPLLSDPDLVAAKAYGVADEGNGIAWPSEFLVDAPSVVRWRATAQAVSVRPTANDVLRAFDETER
jgi:peroxiredoxin